MNICQVRIFKPLYISDLFTGSLPSVKVVLEIAGNSVMEDRDDHNRTALVLATMGGHGEIVNFLLSEGGEYSDFWVILYRVAINQTCKFGSFTWICGLLSNESIEVVPFCNIGFLDYNTL